MKKRVFAVMALLAGAVLAAGCGKEKKEEPSVVAVTPVPKKDDNLVDMKKTQEVEKQLKNVMGVKSAASSDLILINNMGAEIKSVYVRPNTGDDDESWGDDLVQGKFVLKQGDKALYYYEKGQTASYDIRITFTDEDRNECFFRKLPLTSMKQIALCMDGRGEDGIPYAKYLTSAGTKPVSTLKEVKERLGIYDEEEYEEDEQETTPTPTPEEEPQVTVTPGLTVTPEPEGPQEGPDFSDQDNPGGDEQDSGAQQAAQFIGQSLNDLIGVCGSPSSSDYEEDPGTGKTGYHHYSTFTVSTTVDENGNEIVAAIW